MASLGETGYVRLAIIIFYLDVKILQDRDSAWILDQEWDTALRELRHMLMTQSSNKYKYNRRGRVQTEFYFNITRRQAHHPFNSLFSNYSICSFYLSSSPSKMHFIHTALTTLAFASVAFAIVVPATLGDGHWRAQRNTTGHIVWTKIGDVPARRNAPAPIGGGAARFLPARGITNPDAPSVDKRDETGCTGNSLNSIWTTDARNDIYVSIL